MTVFSKFGKCVTQFLACLTCQFIHFLLKTNKVSIVLEEPSFWHDCCEMTEVNKKPQTYFYLHQFNLQIRRKQRIRTTKTPCRKRHLSNASDRFFKRMWLPQLIYSHIQRCFAKKPFSRFVVILERLGERPWKNLLALKDLEPQKICEKTGKTYQKFVGQKK